MFSLTNRKSNSSMLNFNQDQIQFNSSLFGNQYLISQLQNERENRYTTKPNYLMNQLERTSQKGTASKGSSLQTLSTKSQRYSLSREKVSQQRSLNIQQKNQRYQNSQIIINKDVKQNIALPGQQEQAFSPGQRDVMIPERTIPSFIPYKIRTSYHEFKPGDFQQVQEYNYCFRYQVAYPQIKERCFIDGQLKVTIKVVDGFRIISINCDANLHGPKDRRHKKEYFKTPENERINHIIEIIKKHMEKGYDFIVLQEVCSRNLRRRLLQIIQQFNFKGQEKYFYPQNLGKLQDWRITMILSKHQVKFGQLKFLIQEFQNQKENKYYFPDQAYCEFDVNIHGKWESVCIFSCHLRSSGGHQTSKSRRIRKQQIDCIHHFSQNYDRFFSIGDTNIPSSEAFEAQNKYADEKFFDAINYGISQYRGTFLFRNSDGQVVDERIDRVWLDKKSAPTTSVLINYRDDIVLRQCQEFEVDQREILETIQNRYIYTRPTDHTILDLEILFTE